MIARVWHGVTQATVADEYLEYLNATGVPELRATEGNQGVYVLRRTEAENSHFLLISFWDSIESIQRFAGEDVQQARYYPKDRDYLLELEPEVTHYEAFKY